MWKFLNIFPDTDITGTSLSNVILNFLGYFWIDCPYLFGQDYDRASMLWVLNFIRAQAYIKEKYDLALYSHCATHSLNLAVCTTYSIIQVKNCQGTVQYI